MTPRPLAALALALLVPAGLAGCGKTGSLATPGPLFGRSAQEDWSARGDAREADSNRAQGRRPTRAADQTDPADRNADNAPRTRREVQAPEQQNVPITKEPIPGQPDLVGPTPSMRPPGP